MKNFRTVIEKIKKFLKFSKRNFPPFLHSAKHLTSNIFHKFKSVKFLILILLLTFILNSFFIFRINYTENYSLVYRYERVSVLLNTDNYLELYRFHDYMQYKDKSVTNILSSNYQTNFKENKNFLLPVNNSVDEFALGDKANIETHLVHIDSNNFELQREVIFNNQSVENQVETVYVELILGGKNIRYSNSEISYSTCKLEVNYPSDTHIDYQQQANVLIFSKHPTGSNKIDFSIKFTLNCG